jgi:hypothetical protein
MIMRMACLSGLLAFTVLPVGLTDVRNSYIDPGALLANCTTAFPRTHLPGRQVRPFGRC